MADLKFTEILAKLNEIHEDFPSLRFGEIIQKALDEHTKIKNIDLHDRNSKSILKALDKFHNKIKEGY